MTLIERVKADYLQARKDKSDTRGVLSALIGEAEAAGRVKEHRAPTNEEVLATIRSFLKKSNEVMAALSARREDDPTEEVYSHQIQKVIMEINTLESYLPKQLSEDDLEKIVRELQNPTMGSVMSHLKTHFANQYDGKMASTVIKRVIEETQSPV